MSDENIKVIRLKTRNDQSFSDKKVYVDKRTQFANLPSLVRAVCKTDHQGSITERLWSKLNDKLKREEYKIIDHEEYISASAITKLVNQNRETSKKTWGVFATDGLSQLIKQLCDSKDDTDDEEDDADEEPVSTKGASKRKKSDDPSPAPRDRKGKGAATGALVAFAGHDDDRSTEEMLKERERQLNNREQTIEEREILVLGRERKVRRAEDSVRAEQTRLQTLEKELHKKQAAVSQVDMNAFFDQISSLTNKFKTKVTRSRAGSPVPNKSRRNSSPTPVASSDDDDDDDNQATPKKSVDPQLAKGAKSLQQLQQNQRTPSPIPMDSPAGSDKGTPNKKASVPNAEPPEEESPIEI